MSEMVERIAEVIGHLPHCAVFVDLGCNCGLRMRAAEALAVMREPTPAMLSAGMNYADTDLASEWRAMIDEALK